MLNNKVTKTLIVASESPKILKVTSLQLIALCSNSINNASLVIQNLYIGFKVFSNIENKVFDIII